jgi:peptidase M28-like protein
VLSALVGLRALADTRAITAFDHLRAIVDLSRAPEYRRAGSPGMARAARYVARHLRAAGYAIARQDFPFRRYSIGYGTGRSPLLQRLDDGVTFKSESAFYLGRPTSHRGIVCTVKPVDQVRRGDCGFIPFEDASPEWKNSPFVSVGPALDSIVAAHGAGAVIQGDVARNLVYAQRAGDRPIAAVVAVVDPSEILGRRVRLRAVGKADPRAIGHNVIGVRRPAAGSSDYVMLLAHGDAWFQGAADNGSGTAAVLRAAEILGSEPPGIGVIVAVVDAEEIGLLGSKVFSETLASRRGFKVADAGPPLKLSNIKAIVDLDASTARASDIQNGSRLVVRRDAPVFEWRAMVSSANPPLAAAFMARFAAHGVFGAAIDARTWSLLSAGDPTGSVQRSDVQWFGRLGVPFVWPVAGYPEYHTDGDTLATIDLGDLEAIAQASADLIRDVATLPIAS